MSAEFLAFHKVEADDLGGLLLATNRPDFCVGGDITNWPEISNRQLRMTFEQYMSVFKDSSACHFRWWRQCRACASAVGWSSPSGPT
jgi:enoyl-CoA hydratase/carnithine racemase